MDLAWAVRRRQAKKVAFQFLYDVQVRSSTMMMICHGESAKSFTQVVMTALQISDQIKVEEAEPSVRSSSWDPNSLAP